MSKKSTWKEKKNVGKKKLVFNEVKKSHFNCSYVVFFGMVDRRKMFSFILSRDQFQRSSPSRISNTLRTGFKLAQNPSSGLVE